MKKIDCGNAYLSAHPLQFIGVVWLWRGAAASCPKGYKPLCAGVAGVRRSAHVTSLLKELEWMNLEGMVAESHCATMRYVNNPYAPMSVSQRCKRRADVSCRTTRATDRGNLDVPRVRTEHARKFFSYRAVTRWNALPATVRETTTARACRKRYRELVNSV